MRSGSRARRSAVHHTGVPRPGTTITDSPAAAAGDRAMPAGPSAAGTQRRLQALMACSWSLEAVAHAEGLRPLQLARALEDPAVITPALAASVSKAYDRLWNAAPPRATGAERERADAAARTAHARGWAPPAAWDDNLIDKPGAVPEPGWERGARVTMRLAAAGEPGNLVTEGPRVHVRRAWRRQALLVGWLDGVGPAGQWHV